MSRRKKKLIKLSDAQVGDVLLVDERKIASYDSKGAYKGVKLILLVKGTKFSILVRTTSKNCPDCVPFSGYNKSGNDMKVRLKPLRKIRNSQIFEKTHTVSNGNMEYLLNKINRVGKFRSGFKNMSKKID